MMERNNSVICFIFNYNANEKAVRWWEMLSPCFKTVILDSGSNPPCTHEAALNLDNVFYSGLMNKAAEILRASEYKWMMCVTSDIEIDNKNVQRLMRAMDSVSRASNVGLYQPSCRLSFKGRALPQSLCHHTGRMRSVNFQEGWFHMVRRDVLDGILPVDVSINKLGWGIDLALSHSARIRKLMILVDDRIRVLHPKGTGYNKETAMAQMRAWHKTIPGYTSPRHFRPLREKIRYE